MGNSGCYVFPEIIRKQRRMRPKNPFIGKPATNSQALRFQDFMEKRRLTAAAELRRQDRRQVLPSGKRLPVPTPRGEPVIVKS